MSGVVALFLVMTGAACGPSEHVSSNSSTDVVQQRSAVEKALELYVEGMVAGESERIPLASDVVFVEPDGSTESSREGIQTVAPFLERQPIDSILVHQSIVDGEYGCELTDYYWTDGPKMPIALCLRVVDEEIVEIRPYFDRSLFGG
jgi:hypothetical protein